MPTPEYTAIKQKKNAGLPFKANYMGGTGNPVYHLFPVLIGTSPPAGGGTAVERVLCYKHVGSSQGWRCFEVSDLKNIDASNVSVPTIPPVDENRQNCVMTIDRT